jgi:hypothetical protein
MLSTRKRNAIERRLRAEPALSNRALAREFRIDNKTVASIRRGLDGAENPHPKPVRAKSEPVEGADPPADNPVATLRAIMADPRAPATARVAAAKALLGMQKPSAEDKVDRVTSRALQIINGGRE